jgi:hypothetical protein
MCTCSQFFLPNQLERSMDALDGCSIANFSSNSVIAIDQCTLSYAWSLFVLDAALVLRSSALILFCYLRVVILCLQIVAIVVVGSFVCLDLFASVSLFDPLEGFVNCYWLFWTGLVLMECLIHLKKKK